MDFFTYIFLETTYHFYFTYEFLETTYFSGILYIYNFKYNTNLCTLL